VQLPELHSPRSGIGQPRVLRHRSLRHPFLVEQEPTLGRYSDSFGPDSAVHGVDHVTV
jgi:hypothetical protein